VTLPVVLRVLPAVLLSACCCCNLGSFIPDSVEDEIGKNIVEQGVGIATGSKVDIDNGRIDVTTADGERVMLGEGAGGVDPRMPVFGHPDCKVGGGMVMENGDGLNLTMAQEACAVPFDAMKSHYEQQLGNLGGAGEVKTLMSSTNNGERATVLQVTGDGSRFDSAQVMLGEEDGKTGAVVTVTVKKGTK